MNSRHRLVPRPMLIRGGERYIGALKARIIIFMNQREHLFTVFLLSAGGGRSNNSPTHYNLSVLLAFGIQLTINRDSLRFTLSSTLTGGGGGGGGGGRDEPSRANCGSFRCPNYIYARKNSHDSRKLAL